MGYLADAAGADGADVDYRLGHRVEHGPASLQDLRRAADEHRQVAGLSALHAAADRRIQHVHAPGPQLVVDAADQRGGVRRVVDVDRAGPDAGSNAVVAQHDRLHLGWARHAGADDIRPLSHVFGGVGPRRARVEQGSGGVPTQVVDGEVEARRGYLSRHRAADVPDADESDSHLRCLPWCSVRRIIAQTGPRLFTLVGTSDLRAHTTDYPE